MRRPYTLDAYRRLVDSIAGRLPHASIGTDLIAGFPGESDADFAANEAYLPSAPLSHLHVFPYSDRPGTEATGLPGKVAGPVIRERGARLRQIGARLSAWADARGRLASRHRQLSQSQDSCGIGAQRAGARARDEYGHWGCRGGWDFRLKSL